MDSLAPSRSAEVERIFAAPFLQDLGVALVEAGPGRCVASLPLRPRHLQQDGFVHAGVLAALADHTAGGAAATVARDGQVVLTAEFKISFLRAAQGERLLCVATVLKPGAQLTFVESEVHCGAAGAERLVAKASVSIANVDRVRGA